MVQYIMAKSVQKIEARRLRFKGKSIKKIAQKLGVSSSTVSLWCRDIELTKKQIKILERNARDPYYGRRGLYLKRLKHKTDQKIKKLESLGIKKIGKLTRRELFVTGASLYWAEGFKKDSQAGFASLDPEMVKFFINWLKTCFGYENEDLIFRVTANISHKDRIKDIEEYWSRLLEIPIGQFQKPFFQDFKWKKIYANPEQYF